MPASVDVSAKGPLKLEVLTRKPRLRQAQGKKGPLPVATAAGRIARLHVCILGLPQAELRAYVHVAQMIGQQPVCHPVPGRAHTPTGTHCRIARRMNSMGSTPFILGCRNMPTETSELQKEETGAGYCIVQLIIDACDAAA